ncbi:isochorismatase family protein [Halomonas cupida]
MEFPALSAIDQGFDVFVVTDASGTFSSVTRDGAWLRIQTAGAQLVNWFSVAGELHRDGEKLLKTLVRYWPIIFYVTPVLCRSLSRRRSKF